MLSRDREASTSTSSSNIRRLLGAPPSLSRDVIAKSFVKVERNHEASIEEEYSCEESDTAKTADETEGEAKPLHLDDDEGSATSGKRQKRKKRRIRLTGQGLKAKRKAERREKLLAEKKNEVQDGNNAEEARADEISSPPPANDLGIEEPQQQSKPSPVTFTPFQLLCDNLIRKFMAKDPEQYFTHPVTDLEAPGYKTIVECPMAFSTVQEKIERNIYSNLEQFKSDIAAFIIWLHKNWPFWKTLTEEQLGIRLRGQERQQSKNGMKEDDRKKCLEFVSDNQKMEEIMSSAPIKIKERLTKRKPFHIAYLDNKEGALALNVLTATEPTEITLGDHVKPLNKGNPGLCAPFVPRICSDYLISYTNPGPFASFAPHFDMTWATMSSRDSDLILSCYGDKDNVADACALRQMATNSGSLASSLVESMLNDLTENEHSKTLAMLENSNNGELLERPFPAEHRLHKTGKMIEELASMQHHRLSKTAPQTLSETTEPDENEVQLAEEIVQELGQHVVHLGAKPGDLVRPPLLHQALGLDADDYDVLSEFLEV
uniref:Bromo domain-containing protein n=1 Tax=Globodera rostochiensis TaxID=31243 RepID=A0A914HCU6_GLORO